MRSISVAERRARLAVRHHLAATARSADVTEIARSMVALHATDPATVFLSVAARSDTLVPADVERALYEERTLLRMLAMRRTMFVVPLDVVGALQASCADALAVKQRRTYTKLVEQAGVVDGDVAAWWAEVERETHDALLALGAATGAQLSKAVPRLRTSIVTAPGKAYERPTNITTWVLLTLGAEGRIVRGRPNGGWSSSQYTWAPIESWLPGGVPAVPVEEARAEVVRRWLRAFGPAPVTDLKWWTGWTQAEVRSALARLDVAEVDLDGGTGLVLADDLAPVPAPAPAAALQPARDPTPKGGAWSEVVVVSRPARTGGGPGGGGVLGEGQRGVRAPVDGAGDAEGADRGAGGHHRVVFPRAVLSDGQSAVGDRGQFRRQRHRSDGCLLRRGRTTAAGVGARGAEAVGHGARRGLTLSPSTRQSCGCRVRTVMYRVRT